MRCIADLFQTLATAVVRLAALNTQCNRSILCHFPSNRRSPILMVTHTIPWRFQEHLLLSWYMERLALRRCNLGRNLPRQIHCLGLASKMGGNTSEFLQWNKCYCTLQLGSMADTGID